MKSNDLPLSDQGGRRQLRTTQLLVQMSSQAMRDTDASIEQILSYRQTVINRLQCEVFRVISRMAYYGVEMIPEDCFKKIHKIGCNRQNAGNWNGAEEIWKMLVRKEWRVLVYHDQQWVPGICTGVANESRGGYYAGHLMDLPFDPEAKLMYDIKIDDQLLESVDRGRVIIRSELILRLQSELDESKRDLRTLVNLKQREVQNRR